MRPEGPWFWMPVGMLFMMARCLVRLAYPAHMHLYFVVVPFISHITESRCGVALSWLNLAHPKLAMSPSGTEATSLDIAKAYQNSPISPIHKKISICLLEELCLCATCCHWRFGNCWWYSRCHGQCNGSSVEVSQGWAYHQMGRWLYLLQVTQNPSLQLVFLILFQFQSLNNPWSDQAAGLAMAPNLKERTWFPVILQLCQFVLEYCL